MDGYRDSTNIRYVDRSKVYDNVMELFADPHSAEKFPFIVKFEGEMGVDTGGACP